MDTITIQIGNTDDRLSQEEWSDFCGAIDGAVRRHAGEVHFTGSPPADAPRQNACWVFDIDEPRALRDLVIGIRERYRQHSVAWTAGRTELI